MTKIASNLQIDSARLWDTIHETAKFGATAKGGVRRLTLGPEDKQVRDWFRSACEAAGLEVHVDTLGSMFGLRKGRDMSKPPVGLGSHLDTQPTGGKFDGVLGTLAALEVVRTLNDAGIETETPICIVNWTNEEGSRFAPATMASAAYAGDYTTDNILARTDAAGISVGEALDSIGYRGDEAVGTRRLGAFVELHIEQRSLLDVQFDEGAEPARADRLIAAVADAVERFADADAGGVGPRQNVVRGIVAGIGRRGHRRRREARAFLVGPVDDADRRFRFDPGVIEGADDLERRQRAEHAVEFATGRLGIEMRAEPDRRLRHVAALAQPEHRTERVDMHFETRGLARPAEPVAHLLVLGAQRQPPHPACRRGAEFRGFVKRVP